MSDPTWPWAAGIAGMVVLMGALIAVGLVMPTMVCGGSQSLPLSLRTVVGPGEAVDVGAGQRRCVNLVAACRAGHRDELIRLLLSSDLAGGLPMNVVDSAEDPLLHIAAREGHAHLIDDLVKVGVCRVNARDDQGRTALHVASARNHVDVVEHLIGNGANVNAVTVFGHTPLHDATFAGSYDAMKALLESGADRRVRDVDGNRPGDMATQARNREAMRLLLPSRQPPWAAKLLGFWQHHRRRRRASSPSVTTSPSETIASPMLRRRTY
ncbi:Ankyrin repeat domain-containing protein [Plasmodiophora brassicae]|nr:hypothetical protein PBRA_008668 [Plasmodiophora brassicae]